MPDTVAQPPQLTRPGQASPDDNVSGRVNTMHLRHRLRDVLSDRRNLPHGSLPVSDRKVGCGGSWRAVRGITLRWPDEATQRWQRKLERRSELNLATVRQGRTFAGQLLRVRLR